MNRSFQNYVQALACFAIACVLVNPFGLQGQGVTTSSIEIFLGEGVPAQPVGGATVAVVHVPSGTRYEADSLPNGRIRFPNLRVGGPYTITVTKDGMRTETLNGLFLALNEPMALEMAMKTEVVQLDAFVVEVDQTDLDAGSTGPGSVLDLGRMSNVPTYSGSFADMTRNNPFASLRAGAQITALGQNNKFNSISVDGARINDQFGLASSGLFSQNNPFSLDAIEQFSVSLSPYETQQSGFTGASINAVTKSGTNRFSGSAYYIFTNDGLQGKDVAGSTIGQRSPLERTTWGATLGGPIIKDRLFFFLNYEKFTEDRTATDPSFTPSDTELQRVYSRIDAVLSATGVDADLGTFERPPVSGESDEKKLVKLDWNINSAHRMSVRYSETVSDSPFFTAINASSYSGGTVTTGPTPLTPNGTTSLSSSFYTLNILEEVWAGQLYSNWSSNFQTRLSYSKTDSTSERVLPPFPEVRIFNFPGTTRAGAPMTDGSIRFGAENSSHGNRLGIGSESYSLIADYFAGDYAITAGFDHEASDFYNVFRQNSFGVIEYRTVDDFVNDVPSAYQRAVAEVGTPLADLSEFEQTGVFGHVRWQPNPQLSLMLGVRADFVGSPIEPVENTAFAAAFGVSNTGTIDGTTTIAPRFSFNYAVDAERRTQLRGGLGIFHGRSPWVFMSNSYTNTAVGRFIETRRAGTATPPPTLVTYLNTMFDPANPIGTTTASNNTGNVNLMKDGLKLPTVMRGNLAVDHKLDALDAVLSVEYVHTEVEEGFFVENINLRPTTIGADGRQRFAGASTSQPRVAGWPIDALQLSNTSVGRSRYFSVSLDRPMRNGYAYNLAFTAGKATDGQATGSSTASSNWRFVAVFNQNTVEESRSDFEAESRIQASFTREFRFLRDSRTSVSLNYEGRSGTPYSWVYSGDLNTDGINANDVLAVPDGLSDPRFDFSGLTVPQRDAYFAALESYGLNAYAGSYVPRNVDTYPWQNRLDLRIVQELPAFKDIRMEFFMDFINFGSWLSKDFFNYIETSAVATNTGLGRTFGNATYNAAGQIRPTATLNSAGLLVPAGNTPTVSNGDSRWRLQFGARIKF